MWDGCVGIVLGFATKNEKKQRTPSCAQEGDLVKFPPFGGPVAQSVRAGDS